MNPILSLALLGNLVQAHGPGALERVDGASFKSLLHEARSVAQGPEGFSKPTKQAIAGVFEQLSEAKGPNRRIRRRLFKAHRQRVGNHPSAARSSKQAPTKHSVQLANKALVTGEAGIAKRADPLSLEPQVVEPAAEWGSLPPLEGVASAADNASEPDRIIASSRRPFRVASGGSEPSIQKYALATDSKVASPVFASQNRKAAGPPTESKSLASSVLGAPVTQAAAAPNYAVLESPPKLSKDAQELPGGGPVQRAWEAPVDEGVSAAWEAPVEGVSAARGEAVRSAVSVRREQFRARGAHLRQEGSVAEAARWAKPEGRYSFTVTEAPRVNEGAAQLQEGSSTARVPASRSPLGSDTQPSQLSAETPSSGPAPTLNQSATANRYEAEVRWEAPIRVVRAPEATQGSLEQPPQVASASVTGAVAQPPLMSLGDTTPSARAPAAGSDSPSPWADQPPAQASSPVAADAASVKAAPGGRGRARSSRSIVQPGLPMPQASAPELEVAVPSRSQESSSNREATLAATFQSSEVVEAASSTNASSLEESPRDQESILGVVENSAAADSSGVGVPVQSVESGVGLSVSASVSEDPIGLDGLADSDSFDSVSSSEARVGEAAIPPAPEGPSSELSPLIFHASEGSSSEPAITDAVERINPFASADRIVKLQDVDVETSHRRVIRFEEQTSPRDKGPRVIRLDELTDEAPSRILRIDEDGVLQRADKPNSSSSESGPARTPNLSTDEPLVGEAVVQKTQQFDAARDAWSVEPSQSAEETGTPTESSSSTRPLGGGDAVAGEGVRDVGAAGAGEGEVAPEVVRDAARQLDAESQEDAARSNEHGEEGLDAAPARQDAGESVEKEGVVKPEEAVDSDPSDGHSAAEDSSPEGEFTADVDLTEMSEGEAYELARGEALADEVKETKSSHRMGKVDVARTGPVSEEQVVVSDAELAELNEQTVRVEVDDALSVEVTIGEDGVDVLVDGDRTTLDDLDDLESELESALEEDGHHMASFTERDRDTGEQRRYEKQRQNRFSKQADPKSLLRVRRGTYVNTVA